MYVLYKWFLKTADTYNKKRLIPFVQNSQLDSIAVYVASAGTSGLMPSSFAYTFTPVLVKNIKVASSTSAIFLIFFISLFSFRKKNIFVYKQNPFLMGCLSIWFRAHFGPEKLKRSFWLL